MSELMDEIQKMFRLKGREVKVFSELFTQMKFDKFSFLAKTGEYSRKMAFVQSGILRAFFQKENGEQYNKTFFVQSDFVGAYSSLVSGKKNLINI